jgi:hypothetical protein
VTRHPPEPRREYDGTFVRYVIGRPAMLIVWGFALWGTLAAARLAWIAVSQAPSVAARHLADPFVLIPVVIALVARSALAITLRRWHG